MLGRAVWCWDKIGYGMALCLLSSRPIFVIYLLIFSCIFNMAEAHF